MKSRILFFAMVAVFSIAQESNANPLGIPDGQYEGSGTIIFDKPVSILKIKSVDFVATRIFKGDLIDGTTIAQTPIGKEVVEVHYRLSQDGDNHYRILDRTANNLEIGSVSCTPGVCRFEVNSAKISFKEDLIRTATGFNYVGHQSSKKASGKYKTVMAPKK